uniref:Lebercilin domain-containing protein n=1 Tax=Percolomonas cosmopolitus TaxID=63605 RepID=A0A7S1KT86_9EUKA
MSALNRSASHSAKKKRPATPSSNTKRPKSAGARTQHVEHNDAGSFDYRVSLTELHELRSENEHLRAVIQNLRQSLTKEKEKMKKRTDEKTKLERIMNNQSRVVAQEKLSTKAMMTELKQLKRDFERVKKSESSLRTQNQNLLAGAGVKSPSRSKKSSLRLTGSTTHSENEEIDRLKRIIDSQKSQLDKKAVQIKEMKSKIKRRNDETKKDMDTILSYVADLQHENQTLTQSTRLDMSGTEYNALDVSLLRGEDNDSSREVASPTHSLSLEEAERIADDILRREFSSTTSDTLREFSKRKISSSRLKNGRNTSQTTSTKEDSALKKHTTSQEKPSSPLKDSSSNLLVSSIRTHKQHPSLSTIAAQDDTSDHFMDRINNIFSSYNYESLSPMLKDRQSRHVSFATEISPPLSGRNTEELSLSDLQQSNMVFNAATGSPA